ncbi:MAG: Hsp20/alpha crystallin family protein [Rhodospirillales bacterium]
MVEKSDLTGNVPDWFSQFYGPVRRFGEKVAEFFSPDADAAATDAYYEVCVELPGVSEEDMKVEVHDGRLSVTGEKRAVRKEEGKNFFFSERSYGRFQRVFRLPPDADEAKISASHKDGVLTIRIAKAKAEAPQAKSIPIDRG